MTKQDYQKLALAFQAAYKSTEHPEETNGIRYAMTAVADALKADNSAFSAPLFIQACTPGRNVRARKVDLERMPRRCTCKALMPLYGEFVPIHDEACSLYVPD